MVLPTHNRFDFTPISKRPDYSWPGGKRLAMYVALNVETFGFGMEVGPVLGNAMPMPDHRNWSWREYGNRVGVWRLLDFFDEIKLPASHLVNAYLYDTHPDVPIAIRGRGDEFVGHGRTGEKLEKLQGYEARTVRDRSRAGRRRSYALRPCDARKPGRQRRPRAP